jgi:hypothetical protein
MQTAAGRADGNFPIRVYGWVAVLRCSALTAANRTGCAVLFVYFLTM